MAASEAGAYERSGNLGSTFLRADEYCQAVMTGAARKLGFHHLRYLIMAAVSELPDGVKFTHQGPLPLG